MKRENPPYIIHIRYYQVDLRDGRRDQASRGRFLKTLNARGFGKGLTEGHSKSQKRTFIR